MNKPNPITDAIGVVKLTRLHFQNPTAVPAEVVRDATEECLRRLEHIPPAALQLVGLYTALLAVAPHGWLPHVTLTPDPSHPYGAVIVDEAGNIAASAKGKSVDGIVALMRIRLANVGAECAA